MGQSVPRMNLDSNRTLASTVVYLSDTKGASAMSVIIAGVCIAGQIAIGWYILKAILFGIDSMFDPHPWRNRRRHR